MSAVPTRSDSLGRGSAPAVLVLVAGALIWGCSMGRAPEERIVVRIDGRPITVAQFESQAQELRRTTFRDIDSVDAAARKRLLDAVIARNLLLAECRRRGYDSDPETVHDVGRLEQRIVIEALYAREAYRDTMPTEAQLQEYYRANGYDVEVHSQHVLCSSDSVARLALARLNRGEPFADVVRDYTTSGSFNRFGSDGDVGWWKVGEMPPGPREVVAQMPVGSLYPEPVPSSLGFHVIKLTDRRPVPFDSVRVVVEKQIEQERRASQRLACNNDLRQRYEMQFHPANLDLLIGIPADQKEPTEGGDSALVSWKGGALTVADYMALHRFGQVRHPASQSREGLQSLVDNLAGQQVMMAEGRRLGLDRDPGTVERTTQKLDQMMLEELLRGESRRWPVVADDEVRAYFDENPGQFTRADGTVAQFEMVRGGIRSRLEARVENRSMDALIDSLRAAADVAIDDEVLAAALEAP
ncbi:MAG: peptidylprolyl isomerase [Gemmatimonadota bacterium]